MHGVLYLGSDSRRRPVEVELDNVALHAREVDGTEHRWPRAGIVATPPLASTDRTLDLDDKARLTLPDSEALQAWLPRAGIEGWVDRLERRWVLVAGAALTTVVATVLFLTLGLPWIADRAARQVPAVVEQQIGRQGLTLIDRAMLAESRLSADRQAGLRRQFELLIAGLPREADYRLEFRRGRVIGANALALPGGIIVLTDELVELAGDDGEIIAVLAHEAGHHEHYHGMRTGLRAAGLLVALSAVTGDAGTVTSNLIAIPLTLVENGHSRRFEREADAFAFDLLLRKGHSPAAFARLMERFEQRSGSVPGWLSTHPSSGERAERAKTAEAAAMNDVAD